MKRSSSLYSVRSIDGHGCVSTKRPWPSETGSPVDSSRTSANTPGNGCVAEPGLVAVIPGRGVIMIAPVSVCHQVSTIGQRSDPITLWYQSHAFGLIGSPTEPSSRRLLRLCLFGHSAPHLMHARIAVGAQYRVVTP